MGAAMSACYSTIACVTSGVAIGGTASHSPRPGSSSEVAFEVMNSLGTIMFAYGGHAVLLERLVGPVQFAQKLVMCQKSCQKNDFEEIESCGSTFLGGIQLSNHAKADRAIVSSVHVSSLTLGHHGYACLLTCWAATCLLCSVHLMSLLFHGLCELVR